MTKILRNGTAKNIKALKYAATITVYLYLGVQYLKPSQISMRHYTFYFLVCLLICAGCKNASDQKVEETKEITENIRDITPKDIESLRFDDYTLSGDSKKALENWQKYQELSTQVDYINKADFSFFSGDTKVLKAFINDFKTEMPEAIKTAPILSRVTALETKLLKLNSILRLDNMDKATRLSAIKEFLVAMSYFNLQVNKKMELEANRVEENNENNETNIEN